MPKRWPHRLGYLLCGLMLSTPLWAIAPPVSFISTSENLNLSTASVMLQDAQGFIWLGSRSGLFRFDGYHTLPFSPNANQANSLPHSTVAGLFEDGQQRLWVGTRDGLVLFQPKTNTFQRYDPPVVAEQLESSRQIQKMVPDNTGGLWLATRNGVQHFDPSSGQFQLYRHDPQHADSLNKNNVQTLAVDAVGGLWVATWPNGIDYLPPNSQSFTHYPDAQGQTSALANTVKALHVDRQQRLWIGTEAGVFRWQANEPWASKALLPVDGVNQPFRVNHFIEDRNGTLWAASMAGLLRWDAVRQQFDRYTHQLENPNSIGDDFVFTVMQDRTGTLWVATTDGISYADLSRSGMQWLTPRTFSGVTASTDNFVQSITENDSGQLWLGGRTGVTLIDPVTQTIVDSVSALNGLPKGLVFCVYYTPADKLLWIGTRDGLYRHDTQRHSTDKIVLGTGGSNFVNGIAADSKGHLWIGTGAGLYEYHPTQGGLRRFQHQADNPNSLSSDTVNAVFVDAQDRVWTSGAEVAGGGLSILDPTTGQFRRCTADANNPQALPSNYVITITADAQGAVWLGTSNSGFAKALPTADGGWQFTAYGRDSISQQIKSLQFDRNGLLWLTTDTSLLQFTPATEQLRDYQFAEGRTNAHFAGRAHLLHRNGRLYFGGYKGLLAIDPDRFAVNQQAPDISMTDIRVLNQSLASDSPPPEVHLHGTVTTPEALQLPWHAAALTLRFSALHFADPRSNQYAYQLQGFDADWITTDSNNRQASYTNLSPGEYRFAVKASNNNGVWNTQGISFPISVVPPFWQTLWFKALGALAIGSSLLLAYGARIRTLRRIQARLESTVAQRTEELQAALSVKTAFIATMSHEIRTPMNAIIGMTQLALDNAASPVQQQQLQSVMTASQALLAVLNSILDFSKLEQDKLTLEHEPFAVDVLINTVTAVALSLLGDKPIALDIKAAPTLPPVLMGDGVRLQQVLLNLLSNAIKFTEHGHIKLSIDCQWLESHRVALSVSVADTGIGMSPQQLRQVFSPFTQADSSTTRRYGGTGLGLSICQALISAMGGHLFCDSTLHQGSVFSFRITLAVAPADTVLAPVLTASQSTAVRDRGAGLSHLQLLLVEDNPMNRDLMQQMLSTVGIAVTMAENGKQALALLAQMPVDGVLMDCLMPEMDGYAATQQIRADGRWDNLPIIGLTANILPADKQYCLQCGMNAVIDKPIEWSTFFDALRLGLGMPPLAPNAPALTMPPVLAASPQTAASIAAPWLDELVALISHDANQPLTELTTAAQLCLFQLDSALPDADKLRRLVQSLSPSATAAGKRLQLLRTVIKCASGTAQTIAIAPWLADNLDMFEVLFTRADISVNRDLPNDLPAISTYPARLQQVIQAVLLNSIEALQQLPANAPRQLWVRAVLDGEQRLNIAITDNGGGLSHWAQQTLWQPFSSQKPQHLGMGLYLSRCYMQSMGGEITLDSTDNTTTVILRLPLL